MTEEALRDRVAELEARLDATARAQAEHERSATDPQGRKWTVSDLMGMGLTRRQALGAVAAIAGGATLSSAFSGSAAAQPTGDEGVVGESGERVEVWASEVDALEVATGSLTLDGSTISNILESDAADIVVRRGSVSHSDPGTASDGTVETFANDSQSVTFATAFSSAPIVIISRENTWTGAMVRPVSVTTTGFDSNLENMRSGFSSTATARWVAIGPQ